MTKPKTIAEKLVDLQSRISQVRSGKKLELRTAFYNLLAEGRPTKDLYDKNIKHTVFHDGSILTRNGDTYSAGGGEAMTTNHPLLSICAVLAIASTVDWLANLIGGVL